MCLTWTGLYFRNQPHHLNGFKQKNCSRQSKVRADLPRWLRSTQGKDSPLPSGRLFRPPGLCWLILTVNLILRKLVMMPRIRISTIYWEWLVLWKVGSGRRRLLMKLRGLALRSLSCADPFPSSPFLLLPPLPVFCTVSSTLCSAMHSLPWTYRSETRS